jgi:hypothetical protein
MGRPGTTRNSNGAGRPEIQTIRAFLGLGRAGPGGPNVHLYRRGCPSSSPLQDEGKTPTKSPSPTSSSRPEAHVGLFGSAFFLPAFLKIWLCGESGCEKNLSIITITCGGR